MNCYKTKQNLLENYLTKLVLFSFRIIFSSNILHRESLQILCVISSFSLITLSQTSKPPKYTMVPKLQESKIEIKKKQTKTKQHLANFLFQERTFPKMKKIFPLSVQTLVPTHQHAEAPGRQPWQQNKISHLPVVTEHK